MTRKELQTTLKKLEAEGEIDGINYNAKTTFLEEIYQGYLQSQAPPVCTAPTFTPLVCPVCEGEMKLDNNWWNCSHCNHKQYNR